MDENGIELAGNGSLFAVSHTTFDYLGSGVGSTSTLITVNGIQQSTITLVDVTYSSTTGNKYNYNYTILNSSGGLTWTNQQYSGKLSGRTIPSTTKPNSTSSGRRQHLSGHQNVGAELWSTPAPGTPNSSRPNAMPSRSSPPAPYARHSNSDSIYDDHQRNPEVQPRGRQRVQHGRRLKRRADGTLDMGTMEAIPQGTTAYLILSTGTYAGQYGLVVILAAASWSTARPKP